MYRFSEVNYDSTSQTVDVGPGLIWDDVYAALEPFGVNVVGGRVTGVGVAGFSLGGGYSWLTNQHGLTVDNIVSYELVLPNGTVTTVDENVLDLFFALKVRHRRNVCEVFHLTQRSRVATTTSCVTLL